MGPSEIPEDFGELEKLGVINICGVDREGRPIIIVSACRFPNNNTKEHLKLLEYIKFKLGTFHSSRKKNFCPSLFFEILLCD